MERFRYVPQAIQFAEGDKQVQIIRVGKFSTFFGEVEITKETLQSFKKNFDAKVRGVDLAIDYSHRADEKAAGWIKSIELKNKDTELWAEVEFTPQAQESVDAKEFRYLSADFTFEYKDNESGENHGPTLFGAGLTNRPVVKNMEPVVALQEYTEKNIKPVQENQNMEKENQSSSEIKTLEEKNGQLLSEIANLKAELNAKEQAEKEAEEARKIEEKKNQFDELMKSGKAVEAQRDAYMENDVVRFGELAQPVNFEKESSSEEPKEEQKVDAFDKAMELAEKKIEDGEVKGPNKLGDALKLVFSENPELEKEYYNQNN